MIPSHHRVGQLATSENVATAASVIKTKNLAKVSSTPALLAARTRISVEGDGQQENRAGHHEPDRR